MAPKGSAMAPKGDAMAPKGSAMAPKGSAMAPKGSAMAPKGDAMAPKGSAMAPKGSAMAPKGETMAPKGERAASASGPAPCGTVTDPAHGRQTEGKLGERRGFTILELSAVLAVMAIITSLAIPGYQVLVRRARASEARTVVVAIAHAELRHYRDQGAFLACAPSGPVPSRPAAFPGDAACWKSLGISIDGPVAYRYGVALEGDSFMVLAEGDLDRDGLPSRYTLSGRDLNLVVQDELE
jgi:AP-1 complex subunit sigma 1/2